jgi:YD repeat-containing protein
MEGLAGITYNYDQHGRLHLISIGSGAELRQWAFDYDSNGYLDRLRNPLDQLTSLKRDAVGRIFKKILPDNREIGIGYDDNNNITSITPPARSPHTFKFNAVDQLTDYIPPTLADGTSTNTKYVENIDGQLQTITDLDARSESFTFVDKSPLWKTLSVPTESLTLPISGWFILYGGARQFIFDGRRHHASAFS